MGLPYLAGFTLNLTFGLRETLMTGLHHGLISPLPNPASPRDGSQVFLPDKPFPHLSPSRHLLPRELDLCQGSF